MAAIKDIVIMEGERSEPRHYSQVHLYQEGSFLRAYEWSAWLLCHYVHEFKATRRAFKDIEGSVVFVGFPRTSMEKFVPGEATVDASEEKHTVMTLPMDIDEEKLKQMRTDFDTWKEQVPLSESSRERKGEGKADGGSASVTLTEMMHRVMSFPIESKSPIDCMLFLAEVRRQMAKMI